MKIKEIRELTTEELLNKIEEYFRENGINFYDKNGYHSRMIIDIKKL